MRGLTTPGTRVRLFPNYAEGFVEPEVVELSVPRGMTGPGPSDASMYTVYPLHKPGPYDPPAYLPPYPGPVLPPAVPDRDGHFDHIPVDSDQFRAAHLYGTVRRTLDIWENYLNRHVSWWDVGVVPRLELVTAIDWANAQSGPGFIEMGQKSNRAGRPQLFCLNYDVIAHETGHAILFSQIGVPPADMIGVPFLAFHESFSDLVALIGALHFYSVTVRLLQQTQGNLYVLNLVNRIGEISGTEQIRLADNTTVMADVAGITLAPDGSWIDPLGQNRNQHAIAAPLTGAIFDILVEIYQDGLVARRLIASNYDPRGWTRAQVAASMDRVHHESARAFARFADGFHAALEDARYVVGRCMAHVMLTIRPETLTFGRVAARFLEAAAALGQASIVPALLDHFLWRGIDPRPFLMFVVPPGRRTRADTGRGLPRVRELPNPGPLYAGCDRHGLLAARGHMRHPHRAEP
ncbi:MAG: hypothetical protein JO227_06450 [Acetobacteraceae bacterium]|nr:hypothetical protein [Acetobacteraceae bacterium]